MFYDQIDVFEGRDIKKIDGSYESNICKYSYNDLSSIFKESIFGAWIMMKRKYSAENYWSKYWLVINVNIRHGKLKESNISNINNLYFGNLALEEMSYENIPIFYLGCETNTA